VLLLAHFTGSNLRRIAGKGWVSKATQIPSAVGAAHVSR
jgi:hypothetical protein